MSVYLSSIGLKLDNMSVTICPFVTWLKSNEIEMRFSEKGNAKARPLCTDKKELDRLNQIQSFYEIATWKGLCTICWHIRLKPHTNYE